MKITIDKDTCIGCGICVKQSPKGYSLDDASKAYVLDVTAPGLNEGATKCPVGAITVESTGKEAIPVHAAEQVPTVTEEDNSRDVWVFAEQRAGKLAKVSLQLLGKARGLADQLGQQVVAVLIGSDISRLANELIAYQADKVFVADQKNLEYYQTIPYSKVIINLIKQHNPRIVLFGATSIGRDLAPRISQRVRTGLTADCTELTICSDSGCLDQTRPAFGGNIMATIQTPNHRPQMSTVRPGIMKEKAVDTSRTGEIIPVKVELEDKDLICKIVEFIKEAKHHVNLEEATVIVSGGRGVGSKEGFQIIKELAEVLGGEVGGSRVAVESGWVDHEHQIGQTGKAVSPELYIACGISGAIQHQAGMSKSRVIVAINKDPEAQIMNMADYAIIGNIQEVVPLLIKELKNQGLSGV